VSQLLDCQYIAQLHYHTLARWHATSIIPLQVIRITTHQQKSRTVVTIAGRLASADLKELQRVRRSLPANVILDLGGLDVSVDDGLQVLRAWLKTGAQLVHAAPYLRMVLDPASAPAPKEPRI
jgi:hypothetical protein